MIRLSTFFFTRTWFFIMLVSLLFLASCRKDYVPKPYAYFRIDLPEKVYKSFNPENCPYSFDLPNYALVSAYTENPEARCFYNIHFPLMQATVHVSYLSINEDDLRRLLNESYEFAYKHQVKASSIDEERLEDSSGQKYGIMYHIRGNAASPLQFFVTDSTNHFLRASLYFETRPNIDSIAPVLSFIEQDIYHLIESLKWNPQE